MSDLALMVWLACGSLAAIYIVVRVWERQQQRGIESVIDRFVSEEARETIEELQADVADHKHMLNAHWEEALSVKQDGDYARAVGLLQEGIALIQEAEPDHMRRLRNIALLARTITFMVPLPPVAPYVFRSWRLRGLAGITAAANTVLLTGAERTRLRLWMLLKALGLSLKWLLQAGADLEAPGQRPDAAVCAGWQRVRDLIDDFVTSDGEAVRTARQVIYALDASRTHRKGRAGT